MQSPEILLFFHLPGDIDVLGPVLERACAHRPRFKVLVGGTESFLARTDAQTLFAQLRAEPFTIGVGSGDLSDLLADCRAIVTGSETTLKPHRPAHELTLAFKARGALTYTIQHGLENVGLSYFDSIQGTEVRFAADRVFTWGEAERLQPPIPDENRSKACAVGRPAFLARPPEPAWPISESAIDLAVFENLHWHRFDDAYRNMVLKELTRVCFENPSWRVLLKPHPQGRWLTHRFKGSRPDASNLVIADPSTPKWMGVTGQAVIARATRVLTTPSTVALDAAQAAKPIAIFGYGLSLPLYHPLPILETPDDLDRFLATTDRQPARTFVERTIVPGDAAARILDIIASDISG